MVKTQVQIPDHLVREARRIAEQYEMSFAEVVRRGLERLIHTYPPRSAATGPWQLPTLDLGLDVDPFEGSEWRADLHFVDDEVAESRSPETAKPHSGKRSRSATRSKR